ncbi:MAG TPA: efflux RND transporter periplasmic adaptor subunit, partial [Verrucomicrobiae bacterium]
MNTVERTVTPVLTEPETKPAPLRVSGSRLAFIGFVLLALAVLAVVAGYLPRARQRGALLQTTRELATPFVSVVSPAPGPMAAALTLPAEVRAFVEGPIYARANGYLKRRLVDIGSRVTTGQLLAEIDTPELSQELAQSRAQLKQAEASEVLARSTSARWAEMLKAKIVSPQDAEEKDADLAVKAAAVNAAKANVTRLEELQSFARITAPFEGTITMRRTDVGDLISATANTAGGTAAHELFRIAQTDKLRVFVRVPQSAARAVVPGVTAEVVFPEMPNQKFTAKVVRTSGAMNSESRTLLTELELDNAEGKLIVGSYAQARFVDAHTEAPLTLPAHTLIFRAEGPQVAVVGADGKVALRQVTLGRDLGPTFEVLAGVNPSDRVVLNPPDSLISGMTVRVAAPAAPDNSHPVT